jgi:hypothetical protein
MIVRMPPDPRPPQYRAGAAAHAGQATWPLGWALAQRLALARPDGQRIFQVMSSVLEAPGWSSQ